MLVSGLLCVLCACGGFGVSDVTGTGNGTRGTSGNICPLLLVSFDGFRADYLDKYPFPNLRKFFSDGLLVDHLTNVFITKTFPNHYSLATGLYAESHGILASQMYDPETKKKFSLSNDSDPFWWNEATPIWVSVQNSGYKTAAAMWPGTDVRIQNSTPTHFFKYNPHVTFQERLGNLTKWMIEDSSVKFSILYWEEPDRTGHISGPENKAAMTTALKEVDDNIGILMDRLKQAELWEKINVIIVSDHGMAQCSQDRLIRLDSCLDPHNYTIVDLTPVAAILPLSDPIKVYNALSKCNSHMKAYMKELIPEELHYKHNQRIQPIILVADEGWTIVQNGTLPRLGDHGYLNSLRSMHPLMAAHGPAFRKGYKISSINSVDVYPLMCHLLGIPAMPNNGSFNAVRCALVGESCLDVAVVVGIVIGVLLVLTTLTCMFRLMKSSSSSSSRPFARLELQEDDDDPLLE
ncbi:bis(5'-adenosyl)-triphosphatase enpp4 [Denticeps clupeoides]|uniref:bis(5'-adenosyl)-triphosphatase n=1 Tax=Denticeps clupeoides TaxID=299321 RepID=A0AAY4DI80_9TELE|nr:bis(5'-adenosyl)-triphosphatase ENPP4 [Denticeps clupeoides]